MRSGLRIGVDVDDVLAESLPGYLEAFREYFGRDVKIEEAARVVRADLFRSWSSGCVVVALNVLILVLMWRHYSLKLRSGFSVFERFIDRSIHSDDPIDSAGQPYAEMRSLAEWLNRMLFERQQREAVLREKTTELLRFRQAIDEAPVSVVITDSSGAIQYVNPKFSEVTGYSPGEVLGRNPKILSSGNTPDTVYQGMWGSLLGNGYWQGELWDRRKDGHAYPKWAAITVIRNERGEISHRCRPPRRSGGSAATGRRRSPRQGRPRRRCAHRTAARRDPRRPPGPPGA